MPVCLKSNFFKRESLFVLYSLLFEMFEVPRGHSMTLVKSNNTTIDESTEVTEKLMKKKNAIVKINELIDEEDEITLEDLAPDGGWGWMIALAMILIIVSTTTDMIILNI